MKIYPGMAWGYIVLWQDSKGIAHYKKFETLSEAEEFRKDNAKAE